MKDEQKKIVDLSVEWIEWMACTAIKIGQAIKCNKGAEATASSVARSARLLIKRTVSTLQSIDKKQ